MNDLPLDLENIILDYKNGAEHFDKFKFCLNYINNIKITYQYNSDSLTYETKYQRYNKIKKSIIETNIYQHPDKSIEIESYSCQKLKVISYSLFENNNLSIYSAD